MRVILEGPDNSGKTSLAHHLLKGVANLTYFHPGGAPDSDAAEDVCLTEQQARLEIMDSLVLDRVTAISQRVYSPNIARDAVRELALGKLLRLADTVVIYCRPPNERLMDTASFTWRQEETEEHRQKIVTRQHEFVTRYDELMQRVPCVTYDYTDVAHADIVRVKLVQALQDRSDAVMWFNNLIAYGSGK